MRMTGGEAVVRSLEANGVTTVFGIPGTHNLAIYDALLDSDIRHVTARHEQGAAFMADGYARASGQVGICLCTSGPAILNAAASLGTAYCDSSPVLCVASQIPSDGIGKEKGYIHECRDQLACLQPVTAWCERADTVTAIPDVLHKAFTIMQTGRPRPVAIEVPCDILDAVDEVTTFAAAGIDRLSPPPEQIEQAFSLLTTARRPLIWSGGGVILSDASDELRQLAEHLQAPVCTTVQGKGALAADHPLLVGSGVVHPIGEEFLRQCDVMLAVGTRFTQEDTNNWTLPLPKSLIHIDVDAEEHGRNYAPEVTLLGDARESLRALYARFLSGPARHGTNRVAEVANVRRRILEDCRDIAPAGVELISTLRDALPRDTLVVSDLTLAAYWCRRLLDVYEPRTNIYPWGFCTLGFGLSAAIGARVACPDRPLVVITGDAGFQFNIQELATAVECELQMVVLLFNNSGFGVLKPQQLARYERTLAADLMNPDFVALAQAYGVSAKRVSSLDQLGPAVSAAINSGRTTVLEVTADIPLPVMEPAARDWHNAALRLST